LLKGLDQDLKSTLFFDFKVLWTSLSELAMELSFVIEFFFRMDFLAILLNPSEGFLAFCLQVA
jgi:hypothetical protein